MLANSFDTIVGTGAVLEQLAKPAAVSLVVRQRKGIAGRAHDLARISLTVRWDRSPNVCALVVPRLPVEGYLHYWYSPQHDNERGYEFASFAIPAWARDPRPEWCPERLEAGQLFFLPTPAFSPEAYAQNPQQRQIRFLFCASRRGEPDAYAWDGSLFAAAEENKAVSEFVRTVRASYNQRDFMDSDSILYMAVEVTGD
jgi:hypothetical protein